jgi:hypothetical protein
LLHGASVLHAPAKLAIFGCMRPSALVSALVLLGGCWTGSGEQPAKPATASAPTQPTHFALVLERGACLGACPIYRLAIDASGRVQWRGEANVAVAGTREGRLSRADLEALEREVETARFFERDAYGHLPRVPTCVTTGNTRTCSFSSYVVCSDTSHTILTVRRGSRSHRINNPHCSDGDRALEQLESQVIERTGAAVWIGRRR